MKKLRKRKIKAVEPLRYLAWGINLNDPKKREIKVAYSDEDGKAYLLDDREAPTLFQVVKFKFIRWADK